jgi:hypothetical protein
VAAVAGQDVDEHVASLTDRELSLETLAIEAYARALLEEAQRRMLVRAPSAGNA